MPQSKTHSGNSSSGRTLSADEYRRLVEQVTERVWKRWLADQRLRRDRQPVGESRSSRP